MIHQLTSDTIAKIAAGEIIEEPASILKELLENSIDAGSTKIQVQVKETVKDFIQVTDNGQGIAKDQLELAFSRHATSKIQSIEDLENIISLGFRGEALASINHVSQVEIISRPKDQAYGARLVFDYGKKVLQEKIGAPIGTTIKVKNLFGNLPVRKKFLKSNRTLWANFVEVFEKIALGTPNVSILVLRDHKKVFQSLGKGPGLTHLYSILGKDLVSHLNEVEFTSSSYKLKGYFSDNHIYRSTRVHEYIYINGRFIRNQQISRAIEEVYQSKIPLQKYPVFVLYIEIDPSLVDVNIHPKKHEVKLSNENQLIPILKEVLSEQFKPSRIPKIEEREEENKVPDDLLNLFSTEPKEESPANQINNQDLIVDNFLETTKKVESLVKKEESLVKKEENLEVEPLEGTSVYEEDVSYEKDKIINERAKDTREVRDVEDSNTQWIQGLSNTKFIGDLFKTYLIFQGKGLVYLMDQHAAHERILYDRYKQQYEEEEVHRQVLLSPEIIDLNPATMALLDQYQEDFSQLGFVFEAFGETSILLREVPYIFGRPGDRLFIENILSNLDQAKNKYSFNQYNIMRKACRAAIKAHDPLEKMEVKSLVEQLIATDDPYTCPHGRPTVIRISQKELEKLFLRVGA